MRRQVNRPSGLRLHHDAWRGAVRAVVQKMDGRIECPKPAQAVPEGLTCFQSARRFHRIANLCGFRKHAASVLAKRMELHLGISFCGHFQFRGMCRKKRGGFHDVVRHTM